MTSTGKTLLIVDDERELTATLKILFEMEGFHVLTAANGADALAAVLSQKVDLIFSDLMMPVMNGFEFLQNLRAQPQFQDIPVVVFSSLGEIDPSNQKTWNTFIRKPFSIEDLLQLAEHYTRSRAG